MERGSREGVNMWCDTYAEEAIKPKRVEQEGVYQLKVAEVTTGTTKPKEGTNESPKKYFKIKCIINYPGYPDVSVFLTEGDTFNANATAFFDTFNLQKGNFNYQSWINAVGYMKIELRKKGEYVNMEPRYILGPDGRVVRQNVQAPAQPAPTSNVDQFGDIPF